MQGLGKPQYVHVSSDQNPCENPFYWLVNGDPYNGLFESLYN